MLSRLHMCIALRHVLQAGLRLAGVGWYSYPAGSATE
jgi:hypothetical protein